MAGGEGEDLICDLLTTAKVPDLKSELNNNDSVFIYAYPHVDVLAQHAYLSRWQKSHVSENPTCVICTSACPKRHLYKLEREPHHLVPDGTSVGKTRLNAADCALGVPISFGRLPMWSLPLAALRAVFARGYRPPSVLDACTCGSGYLQRRSVKGISKQSAI